jgi:hypothetical protein
VPLVWVKPARTSSRWITSHVGRYCPRLTIRIRRQVRNRLTARSLAVHADWANLGARRMTCGNARCCLLDNCESHGQRCSVAAVASWEAVM